jgi:pyruvate/2-oxoglutarate dehydrogenase complex dihydrolipoamide acyltransferase (E2) component
MPKVQMPQLGESVAEGTIGKWLKKPGDHVDKYEPIVEVITDKVNAEVPSPFAGTLTEILVQEGDTVPNNTEIAVIETAGAAAAAEAPAPAKSAEPAAKSAQPAAKSAEPAAKPAEPAAQATEQPAAPAAVPATGPYGGGFGPGGSDERPSAPPVALATAEKAAVPSSGNGAAAVDAYEGRLTPAVRRLAREHNVDLSLIAGTGHAGRVTREDIEKFIEQQKAGMAPAARPAGTPAPAAVAAPATPLPPAAQEDMLKPASPMRRAIAAQMTRAVAVPVAYTVVDVDMSGVVGLRDALKREYQAREGTSLSLDAFVAKATIEALRRHPDFNAHYTDEGHWLRYRINLGVAVAVADGLVVPVIHDADRLSIHGLNREIRALADKARSSTLKLEDIQGGTFTLDNTGWTGSLITAPIINTPEVGILTMESITKRPVVIESSQGDAIAIRPQMYMCLGFDHRATDGAQAGRFILEVKRWLEAVNSTTAIW